MILNISPIVENPSWQCFSSDDNTIIIPSYYHYITIVYGNIMVFIRYFYGVNMVFTSFQERSSR